MATRTLSPFARLRALLGPDAASVRQTAAALGVSAATSLFAGIALGAASGRLEELPGLLVLVPAAIALRGNIFGAFGSRLGTAIHTGTFRLSRRVDTVVGQNIVASMLLTLTLSTALALGAKVVAVGFGLEHTISASEFVAVSVVGGVLASVVILGITLVLSAGSVRFGWDLDIVSGPLVSAAGDVVTIPSLVLASHLVGRDAVVVTIATIAALTSVAGSVVALRSGLEDLVRIVRESLPVLLVAGVADLLAGIAVEKQLASLVAMPALLALVPGFLSSAGSLGSILSARLATKLHLGVVEPKAMPPRAARVEILVVLLLAVPMFVLTATAVQTGAWIAGQHGPGLADLVAAALVGGLGAMVFVTAVAYYGTIAAVRFGLDPDNHGIPLVASTLDLVGAFTLILAFVLLGIV